MRVGHFEVIPEHVGIADFQGGDARPLYFPLLDLHQVILARIGHPAEFIEFGIKPFPDDVSLDGQGRGIGVDLPLDAFANQVAYVQLVADLL